ncbi:MAG: ABC transporter ATP-binding protein [Emergencia sp.]|nr:ABC transporter ATP-binding protein [Emergencia sp.]
MESNHLTVEKLNKCYVNENGMEMQVLKEVSFSVAEGEYVAVLGKSGCGKTTLLNILAGFDKRCDGGVWLQGVDSENPSADRAVVFQSPTLFPWLNVLGNVTYPLKRAGMRKEERKNLAMEIIEKVGLHGYEQYYPHELSGGMQQRVALARVFVMRPPLLLMDEPFAALDAQLREQMQSLLLSLRKDYNPTIVFVTHDVEEAVRLADRVILLGGYPSSVKEIVSVNLSMEERIRPGWQMKILQKKEEIRQKLFGGI